jgi:hypothetical protein
VNATQRKLTIALIAGVLAALGGAAFICRDGLEEQYYLIRLRRDPSLLERLVASGSAPEAAAARDFVEETAGKQALLRLYLVEFNRATTFRDEPAGAGTPAWIAEMLKVPFERAAIALTDEGHSCLTWRKGGHSSYSQSNLRPGGQRLHAVLGLLASLAGETLRLPGLDGFEFHVQRRADMSVESPAAGTAAFLGERGWNEDALRAVAASVQPAAEHVCFFRKI